MASRVVVLGWAGGQLLRAPFEKLVTAQAQDWRLIRFGEEGDPSDVLEVAGSLTDLRDAANELRLDLIRLASLGPAIWLGVSRVLRDDDLARAREEAQLALSLGRLLGSVPDVVMYDDVLLAHLLVSQPDLRAELVSILDPIKAHAGGRKLLRTLEEYVRCDFVRSDTARSLSIHPHTLDYRLQIIERVLGRTIHRSVDRTLITTSLIAHRLAARALGNGFKVQAYEQTR